MTTVSGFTTYPTVSHGSTVFVTEPCEIAYTVVETPVISGGYTLTSTVTLSQSSFATGTLETTIIESCSSCKTLVTTESGFTTYPTVSGGKTVLVTEPCETIVTVVKSPILNEGFTEFSTITLSSSFAKPSEPVIVQTGTTTYTTSIGTLVTVITNPVESIYTIVLSKTTEPKSSESQIGYSVVTPSIICSSCKTSTKIESGISEYTTTSEGSVITVSWPFTNTFVVVESTGISSVETVTIPNSEKETVNSVATAIGSLESTNYLSSYTATIEQIKPTTEAAGNSTIAQVNSGISLSVCGEILGVWGFILFLL